LREDAEEDFGDGPDDHTLGGTAANAVAGGAGETAECDRRRQIFDAKAVNVSLHPVNMSNMSAQAAGTSSGKRSRKSKASAAVDGEQVQDADVPKNKRHRKDKRES
jgi:hypothetical protein